MTGLTILLLATVMLRGLGAGMIAGILLITMPARSRLAPEVYANTIRTMYEGRGVTVYAISTVLGSLLTIAALPWALVEGESARVVGLLTASLIATAVGFAGTARAYPTMRRLRSAPDDPGLVAALLDRFGRWGIVSAVGHLVAFLLLAPALVGR